MKAPEHTKPFNRAHAKAGAPFCGDKGQRLVIMAWDRNHPSHPIVGMEVDGEQEVVAFRDDGETDHNCGFLTKRLVMLPLGYIDGKPVFVGDEIELKCFAGLNGDDNWKRVKVESDWKGTWNDDGEFARWPALAKVYPQTRMTGQALYGEHYNPCKGDEYASCVAVANAALRHAINAGQVVEPEGLCALQGESAALDVWMQKTDWVQKQMDTFPFGAAGQHRADVMRLEIDRLRGEYEVAGHDLGKAERLLESMGFRSVGNGDWQRGPSPVKCFYGHPKKGLYVEGDKASIDKVTAIVARDEARDMAVAEAVNNAWTTVCLRNVPSANIIQLARAVDLDAVIAGVKP